MTRETKIGLLVGLGFIVVFAVLLSQTTSVPATGEKLPIVTNQTPANHLPSLPVSHEVVSKPSEPAGDRSVPVGLADKNASPSPAVPNGGTAKGPSVIDVVHKVVDGVASRLPSPAPLGQSPTEWMGGGSGSGTPLTGQTPAGPDGQIANVVEKKVPPPVTTVAGGGMSFGPSTAVASPRNAELPRPLPTDPGKSKEIRTAEADVKPIPDAAKAPEEYVVKKGETLTSIAKGHYDSSSAKVIAFIVNTNKDRIKDRDRVSENQTLLLPDLPADMFEAVKPLGKPGNAKELVKELDTAQGGKKAKDAGKSTKSDPAKAVAGTPGKSTQGTPESLTAATTTPPSGDYPRLVPKGKAGAPAPSVSPSPVEDRRAPTLAKNDKETVKEKTLVIDKPPTRETTGAAKYRTYEIRPNDTLGQIAAKELGTATAAGEIQKLNKNLDPKKMKPGTMIRLPAARQSGSSPDGTSARPDTSRASV